ncbi:MAG: hypothetical protein AB8F34_15110 [Akkermansiaceae bacterium]
MKYIALLAVCSLASCATSTKGWDYPDPNDGLTPPGNTLNIHNYATAASGPHSQGLTNEELMELAEPKKEKSFSGELTFGVGSRL